MIRLSRFGRPPARGWAAIAAALCAAAIMLLTGRGLADQPHGPRGAVTALAVSQDGKRLAVGCYGQVVLYDTATWQVSGICKGATDTVRAIAFSPDGSELAAGGGLPARAGEVLTWRLDAIGAPERRPGGGDTVEALAFRPDGKQLLAGDNDNTALLFTAWPASTAKKLDEHNGRVTSVAFSPRPDSVFVTGGQDKIVKVWDATALRTVVNFDQSEGGVTGLAFLPDGRQLVGASLDGKLYWWRIGGDEKKREFSGYLIRSVPAHDGGVAALAMSADGKRLATCGADNQVGIWDANGVKLAAFTDAPQPCYAVALSPDGGIVAAAGRAGLVYVWDIDTKRLVNTLDPPALPAPPHAPAPAKNAVKSKSAHGGARSQS